MAALRHLTCREWSRGKGGTQERSRQGREEKEAAETQKQSPRSGLRAYRVTVTKPYTTVHTYIHTYIHTQNSLCVWQWGAAR